MARKSGVKMNESYRDRYAKQYEGLTSSLAPQKRERDRFGEMLQNLAPLAGAAGTAIGAGIGAFTPIGPLGGAAIGGGLGQLAGLGIGEAGAGMTEKYDEEEMRRAALFNALMGMR